MDGYNQNRPFANMTVNLGPVGGTFGTAPGPDGGLGYNPRVLKRDVGPAMNQRYCNYTTVLSEYFFVSTKRFYTKRFARKQKKKKAHQELIISPALTDLLEKDNITDYRLLSEGGTSLPSAFNAICLVIMPTRSFLLLLTIPLFSQFRIRSRSDRTAVVTTSSSKRKSNRPFFFFFFLYL